MGLIDKFANPELFEALSFGEKMIGSTVTMLMGMGITFIVLMLLWGFVALMGRFMEQSAGKVKTSDPAAPVTAMPATSSQTVDDREIAAVIAAAVAAYQESGGTGNLVIRKISRSSDEMTPWISAARDGRIERRR